MRRLALVSIIFLPITFIAGGKVSFRVRDYGQANSYKVLLTDSSALLLLFGLDSLRNQLRRLSRVET